MKVKRITSSGARYLRAVLGPPALPTYIAEHNSELLAAKLATHRAVKRGEDARGLAARHLVL